MSHVDDDEVALLHYGEDAGADAAAHLATCPECASRLRALARTLALAEPPQVPEPPDDYEARVWRRLRPRLGRPDPRENVVPIRRSPWPSRGRSRRSSAA